MPKTMIFASVKLEKPKIQVVEDGDVGEVTIVAFRVPDMSQGQRASLARQFFAKHPVDVSLTLMQEEFVQATAETHEQPTVDVKALPAAVKDGATHEDAVLRAKAEADAAQDGEEERIRLVGIALDAHERLPLAVRQAQAEKDKDDLFGRGEPATRVILDEAASHTPTEIHAAVSWAKENKGLFAQAGTAATPQKFQRRRKFTWPSCDQNLSPHVHERQLDGSMTCLEPRADGPAETGTDGDAEATSQAQIDRAPGPGEQVSGSGGYKVVRTYVTECPWAIGDHAHDERTEGGDTIVTCHASQEQMDAKTAAMRAAMATDHASP